MDVLDRLPILLHGPQRPIKEAALPELPALAAPAAQRVGRTQFDGFHYRRNAQTMRWKEDGMPVIGQEHPGREQEPLPRTNCIERPRQNCEVPFTEVRALRQQLHRQEEEALSEERTPQPRHGVSVPTDPVLFQAEKPQTEKRGLRYLLKLKT